MSNIGPIPSLEGKMEARVVCVSFDPYFDRLQVAGQIRTNLIAKFDPSKRNLVQTVRTSYLVTAFGLDLVENFDRDLLSECSKLVLEFKSNNETQLVVVWSFQKLTSTLSGKFSHPNTNGNKCKG